MKHTICLLLAIISVVPIWADTNCEEFAHIYLSVYMPNYSTLLYDITHNGTIDAPHVDSVWITHAPDSTMALITSYAQSAEPIDISFLANGYYFLYVLFSDCIMRRMFIINRPHKPTDNQTPNTSPVPCKIIQEGQLLIDRNGELFTVDGRKL